MSFLKGRVVLISKSLFSIMPRLASSANRSSVSVGKEKERGNLVWFISRFSIDMPSYSRYQCLRLRYQADGRRSDRYKECIKQNLPRYDIFGVPIPIVDQIIQRERKLET